jgi:hypothetical protein
MELTSTWPVDALERPQPRAARRWSRWELSALLLVAAFLAAELAVIAGAANGPTLDESIYITSGLRTLDGHGLGDGYLAWFAGSLLWPALAGIGDQAAGLAGARALAAVFTTVALLATWRAATVLFGARAGFFTAALAVASGPVIALGHLAVIDAPAVAGIAVALWGVAELGRTGHRKWLVLAAVAFSTGVLAKYPAAACGVALALVLVALRGRRAVMDLALLGLITGAVVITYFLSARGPLVYFLDWRVRNNPTFGVTPSMAAFSQLWYGGLPVLLALAGWLACRRKGLASALLVGAIPFPLYALLSGSSVGDSKQVVFGFVFVLPLAGAGLGRLARRPAGAAVACALVLAAGAFGARQAERMDRAWMDLEPAARFLAARAEPGQRFLIDNSWPFTRTLLEEGKIRSPWAVYDTYRLSHGQVREPLCRMDWFVAAQGAGQWPERVRRRIRACGSFRLVYRHRAEVTNIGRDLSFVTWDAGAEIYRNRGRRRSR